MKNNLADSVLFSGVEPEGLKIIEDSGHTFSADKGAFLFFQDDLAERFYVVLKGKVKIFKTSPDGKEQILLMAGMGESFGEAALFAGKSYPATAEVVESTDLISFSRDSFMQLIHKHPTLAMNVIARLSMLLHHLTRLIQQLSLEDVSTRLAGYILDLLPAENNSGKETATLSEKKMILASILGTIPETLSRAFARLSKLGVISVEGQKISVLDRGKLSDIASGQKI
jgi:CRP/FNR family transcriptional regulator